MKGGNLGCRLDICFGSLMVRIFTAAAVIPIPVSAVDQIATSVIEYKKSPILVKSWRYGIRTIVAVDAIAPTERMAAIYSLVRLVIWRSLTKKIGRIASVQSDKQAITEYPKNVPIVIETGMHLPEPGCGVYRLQK